MKKGKTIIYIKLTIAFEKMCRAFQIEPIKVFEGMQLNLGIGNKKQTTHLKTLSHLFFEELLKNNSQIDESKAFDEPKIVEEYQIKKNDSFELPDNITKTTRQVLNYCQYTKIHSKN